MDGGVSGTARGFTVLLDEADVVSTGGKSRAAREPARGVADSAGGGAGEGPLDGALSALDPARGLAKVDGSGIGLGDGARSVRDPPLGRRDPASDGGFGEGALSGGGLSLSLLGFKGATGGIGSGSGAGDGARSEREPALGLRGLAGIPLR